MTYPIHHSLSMRLAGFLSALVLLLSSAVPAAAMPRAASDPVPMLAYYYIWYNASSWNRAKTDYPILGRYSSDDVSVMHQHVMWAKAAGIKGFIVSWKSTDVLNRRLEELIQVAEEQDFKLAIIYQGLDFERDPQPAARIASDLDYFIQHFASRKPFQLFPKPLVIWSGTWKFSTEDVAAVTRPRRDKLLILASEHSSADYERLAQYVDGDAYYWSSVNPETFSGYQAKLAGMGESVHRNGGLWIPPAAPGFDARMVGGTSQVDRKRGETFLTQINTALASSPDALGIISWNEFSENSQIEPSQEHGALYLDILSEVNHLPVPTIPDFDSSEPSGVFPEILPYSRGIALGLIGIIIVAAFVVIGRRSGPDQP